MKSGELCFMDPLFQNDRYVSIVSLAPDVIYTLSKDGTLTSLSSAFEKITGWKTDDWIGKNFAGLVHPDDLPLALKIFKKTLRGETITTFELRIIGKNDKYLVGEFSAGPDIANGKVVGQIGIARDNTEKRRREEEDKFLTRASKILSSSLDYNRTLRKLAKILVPQFADWGTVHIVEQGKLIQLVVAHKDPTKVKWALAYQRKRAKEVNTEEENQKTLESLARGESILYPLLTDELIRKLVKVEKDREILKKLGLTAFIRVPIMSGKKVLGSISLVSARMDRLYDETDLKFVQEIGKLAGHAIENAKFYYEAQSEIKKRKKTEEQMRKSRDELGAILKNISDGIAVQDEKGKLIYVNDAIAIASGYKSPAEMIANSYAWTKEFELKNENGENISLERFPSKRALSGEINPSAVINYRSKLTGEEKWSQVTSRPVFDNLGRVTTVVTVISDLTQAKELERRKDDFISIASHELKTPLTSIKGYVYLLKKMRGRRDLNLGYLDKIDRQLDKLIELIQDLLDLSRIQSGKIEYKIDKFDIGKLVKDVVLDFEKLDNSHKLILKNGVHKKLRGDKERISQVLVNLMTNAIKYSPNGGKVVVSVDNEEKGVRVSVKDFGIGIAPHEVDKIFDRFYRVKDAKGRTFPGLGIGLYISHEIISRHRGKLWVESKLGKGSTFNFRLPDRL